MAAPGVAAPHVVLVHFARYVYVKQPGSPDYSIRIIFRQISTKSPRDYWTVCMGLTQECVAAPVNNCVLIIVVKFVQKLQKVRPVRHIF